MIDREQRSPDAHAAGKSHAERDCRDKRADIALKEIGSHAGDVADVIAHVVGDNRRISGVILGNARFDLADKVGSHVGGLGVNAAAHTGKERDG